MTRDRIYRELAETFTYTLAWRQDLGCWEARCTECPKVSVVRARETEALAWCKALVADIIDQTMADHFGLPVENYRRTDKAF